MSEALLAYLRETSLRESALLARLRTETARLPEARMQISPEQGQFMGLLVELIGCRRAIEVGVFTGYSGLCVAAAMPDGGRLIACDVSAEWTAIARRYWREARLDHKIDLRLAPATQTLDELLGGGEAGAFDFAFIDADKESYDSYYERCLRLLRPGGLVAIDNALWSGRVADAGHDEETTRAIRALNLKVRDDARVTCSLIPIGDGLLLARKR
jgi:caffeoyl-CoA O-methyltransferase